MLPQARLLYVRSNAWFVYKLHMSCNPPLLIIPWRVWPAHGKRHTGIVRRHCPTLSLSGGAIVLVYWSTSAKT